MPLIHHSKDNRKGIAPDDVFIAADAGLGLKNRHNQVRLSGFIPHQLKQLATLGFTGETLTWNDWRSVYMVVVWPASFRWVAGTCPASWLSRFSLTGRQLNKTPTDN